MARLDDAAVGWMGRSTDPEVEIGRVLCSIDCYRCADRRTVQLTKTRDGRTCLVTTERVADAQEKERLAATYGGSAGRHGSGNGCRLAEMRGIPVLLHQRHSDAADAELPDMNPFIDHRGQMQMLRFAGPRCGSASLLAIACCSLGRTARQRRQIWRDAESWSSIEPEQICLTSSMKQDMLV